MFKQADKTRFSGLSELIEQFLAERQRFLIFTRELEKRKQFFGDIMAHVRERLARYHVPDDKIENIITTLLEEYGKIVNYYKNRQARESGVEAFSLRSFAPAPDR